MNDEKQSGPVKTTYSMRRLVIYAVLLLVAFLLGLVPMWLKLEECANRLSQAERQLSIATVENALSSAVIDARRLDYERARQSASAFFTSLLAETEIGSDSALSQTQREGLKPLLSLRDEIITSLARSEPDSADKLSDLYLSYHKIMKR